MIFGIIPFENIWFTFILGKDLVSFFFISICQNIGSAGKDDRVIIMLKEEKEIDMRELEL